MAKRLRIDIGDVLRVDIEFYDENGALADPATVIFDLRKPDGTIINGTTVTKDAVGKYHADYLISDSAGVWTWRFEGAGGDSTAAAEDQFTVNNSGFYA